MPHTRRGMANGLLGVAFFSGSLPATRLAVAGFTPAFLTASRALIAGLLASLLLLAWRQPRPSAAQGRSLAVVAGGVVLGFPLLTAIALQHITSARSLVFIGLLPLSTALFGVLRGGERPGKAFWAFALAGAGAVAGFALTHGAQASPLGDGLMLAAILVCGLGYAEGAVLTRQMGGWQVISWALLLSTPVAVAAVAILWPAAGLGAVGAGAWAGLAYVSVFSMLLGFIFWYRGLSLGGIARVGQLQLLQPFMGLALAALVLHEPVAPAMLLVTVAVVGCVAGARRFA